MIRRRLRPLLERIESGFDAVFGAAWNPLYHLGALGWFFFWVVAVSGLYIYIFYDSGVTQAYQSVEYMTHTQWYAAGVMRSLHRYASDTMVVVVAVHLLREFTLDRFRGPRWFAWLTGVPLLWFLYASGITGYWVVWDKLAQYVAIATSEWLDTLPLFGEPIARNFLHPTVLSGRFFTLMSFMHIAIPLIMLLLMWVHIQRHMHPKVNPPRGLAIGTLAMLLAVALVHPARSQGPADLGQVPSEIGLDWFYLPLYPLLDRYPGLTMWAVVFGATLLLAIVPWLPWRRREPVAVVDLDNCNGCARCAADCPYSAIVMMPRSDGSRYTHEASVVASRCTSCGICAGACPTSTPFRRRTELVPGIDLPGLPIREIREQSLAAADALTGKGRVLVYGCRHGPDLRPLCGEAVGAVTLHCVGQLPPSFVDFLLSRGHVDGVFLTGCREGDCFDRLGLRWTDARLDGERDPYLRQRVPRRRVDRFWAGIDRDRALQARLAAFRSTLAEMADEPRAVRATPSAARRQAVGGGL